MIRCHCNAPAIYQGACLFHQDPSGVRPNIDTYTGQIRRTPEEQRAAELAARRAMAKERKAPKVIRPVKERSPKRQPDVAAIVKAYEMGQTVVQIGKDHKHCQRTISRVLGEAGVLKPHGGPRKIPSTIDQGAIRTDYIAGIPVKQIAAKYRIAVPRVGLICADLPKRQAGPAPKPIDAARVLEMYAQGMTARKVARALGVAERRVLELLNETGEVRPRLFGEVA